MTRNTLVSLAKKYIMAPGHQLHHVYRRAHPTLLSTSVSLRLNGDLLPLKSHIHWWKRSGYPLPLSRAASLLAPAPPILLTCHFLAVKGGCCRPAHHLRSSQTAGSKLWISPPENQDRLPAHQSAPYDSSTSNPRHAEEMPATMSNRRSPRPQDGRTKKTERECGSTHYVALSHTAFTGVTKLTHTPPTLLACFYFELGWINRIAAGHIRKNTNDQTDSSTLRHHVKP